MAFQVDDIVVVPAYGVGRIVELVTRRFSEAEPRLYYEIAVQQSTMWVPVETDMANKLRPLTPKKELARYRTVLRSCPIPLTEDPRQRRSEILSRLQKGSFRDMCEIVRDLTGRGWNKALGEGDAAALRKAREELCQEWAAVNEVPVRQAVSEVDALLVAARQTYQA